MAAPEPVRNIVIIGGGIIGCCTAYYLTRHPSFNPSTKITILEASKNGVAQGASGKAGGLVAKWAYPRELVDLSFAEHVSLAKEHNGAERWGWRYVGCGNWEGNGDETALDKSGSGVGNKAKRKSLEKTLGLSGISAESSSSNASRARKGLPKDLLWVKESLTTAYSVMAPDGDTAQVHPYLFTTSMLDLAKERGASLVMGRATGIQKVNEQVTGVAYVSSDSSEMQTLPATTVVVAAGAWSPKLVNRLPISTTRAHSITIRPEPSVTISPYVLFTEISLPSHRAPVSPEIYARPDSEVYLCGPGDDFPLPNSVDEVVVDQDACDSIRMHGASISDELRDGTVEKRQACYLPLVSRAGGPIIGPAPTIAKGLVIATGHTCWGICNAPGTGKAIAEFVLDGKMSSGNLAKLDPARYL